MSHELPSNLTRTDEVGETLLCMYETWLQDGNFDREANRHSSSQKEARRRALFQVTNQWLTNLAKQGNNLVVATRYSFTYCEGGRCWTTYEPWHIVNITCAGELFQFTYADDECCDFDEYSKEVHCFVTK